MANEGRKDLLLLCDCAKTEHQIVFTYFDDDPLGDTFIYVHFFLSDQSFWKRLITGIRYIFGHTSKYGHWDEILINPMTAIQLQSYINKYLEIYKSSHTE